MGLCMALSKQEAEDLLSKATITLEVERGDLTKQLLKVWRLAERS